MKVRDGKGTRCPKCGRRSWRPYVMRVVGKYGQEYNYQVYRHPDKRRKSPSRCTVSVKTPGDPKNQSRSEKWRPDLVDLSHINTDIREFSSADENTDRLKVLAESTAL